jgi:tetratricopeptide (TPR) repeat protein
MCARVESRYVKLFIIPTTHVQNISFHDHHEQAMQHRVISKSVFAEILELISSGQLAAAERICIDETRNHPNEPNITALLGAVLVKMRKFQEAERYLKKAVELAPTFAKPHEDLGFVLLELNRPQEAIEVLEKATRLDPKLNLAFLNLGKALAAVGKGKEADVAFEKSFELSPEHKLLARAVECLQEKQFEEAERICREIIRNYPGNVEAFRLMGRMAARQNRVGIAERQYRKALEIAPDYTGVIVDLGKLLRDDDRFEEAIACFRQAIEMEPENARFHDLLANALAPAALTYEAIKAHQRAIELDPKLGIAWLGLGHMLKTVGRQQEAIEAYHRCYELEPDIGAIQWSLANLKTYHFTDEEIEDIEAKVERNDLRDESEVNFLFALAKAWEDRKEYGRAWHYYHEGNSKRRLQEVYDPVETEVSNDMIIDVFSKELLEKNAGVGNADPAPIFVIGLPRSGSTLIEQILASHSLVEGTSELPYVTRITRSLDRNRADGINYPRAIAELNDTHFVAMGQDYINFSQMHRTEGKQYFIDKNPNNFPAVGFIRMMLPNAKIIDARRHPMDACFSCYRQLFAKGQPYTYDLTDIGEYYLQYQRMMDYWHDVLPGRVLTVQYEEVVTDFENQVRRLLEYCGLPFEEGCLNFYDTERPVRTASSEQVRQPIYTKSMSRWRHYEQHLDELKEVLEPILPRYEQYAGMSPDD